MTSSESPFFEIPIAAWIDSNRSAFAVWDAFPVSAGHALVVTRRPLSTWWEATPEERTDVFELVDAVRARVTELHHPDGFNVGLNLGRSAGGSLAEHLHMHVVPRWSGDANFITVIGDTKVVPQLLSDTRALLADEWARDTR